MLNVSSIEKDVPAKDFILRYAKPSSILTVWHRLSISTDAEGGKVEVRGSAKAKAASKEHRLLLACPKPMSYWPSSPSWPLPCVLGAGTHSCKGTHGWIEKSDTGHVV